MSKITTIISTIAIVTTHGKYKIFTLSKFSSSYEIIYIDPPYEVENSEVEKILKKILTLGLLSKFGVVAIERDAKAKVFSWPVGLSEAKVRSYGAGAIHYGVLSEPNQSENG